MEVAAGPNDIHAGQAEDRFAFGIRRIALIAVGTTIPKREPKRDVQTRDPFSKDWARPNEYFPYIAPSTAPTIAFDIARDPTQRTQ